MSKFDTHVSNILESLKRNSESEKETKEDEGGFDAKKADLNHDGKISEYERKRGEAIQKAVAKKGDKK